MSKERASRWYSLVARQRARGFTHMSHSLFTTLQGCLLCLIKKVRCMGRLHNSPKVRQQVSGRASKIPTSEEFQSVKDVRFSCPCTTTSITKETDWLRIVQTKIGLFCQKKLLLPCSQVRNGSHRQILYLFVYIAYICCHCFG